MHDFIQVITKKDNICHMISHTLDNVHAYTARPTDDFKSIASKAEWLLKLKEIVFSSAREDWNVHGLAELIFKNADVSCSLKIEIGIFPEEISIITEHGRTKYVRRIVFPHNTKEEQINAHRSEL